MSGTAHPYSSNASPCGLSIQFHPFAIHDDGRDGNDNNKVEHMCSIEVERKKLSFEVSGEVVLGFSRILLQLFDQIWHHASPKAFEVAKANVVYAISVSMSYSCLPCAFQFFVVPCCSVMPGRSERGSAVANAVWRYGMLTSLENARVETCCCNDYQPRCSGSRHLRLAPWLQRLHGYSQVRD